MRTEREMLDLIIETAREDSRIKAVLLSGSRGNPDAPKDCFQDYDIMYIATEVRSFVEDVHWVDRFGERMIMQTPDIMDDSRPNLNLKFTWLMQFVDGTRIDLTIHSRSKVNDLKLDSQTTVLLDKDRIFTYLPAPSNQTYLPQPVTRKEYEDCCNEFWWVSAYVAKGLWRRELPYAKEHLELHVRDQLIKMLGWLVGENYNYQVGIGKSAKYLEKYLPSDLWLDYLKTYVGGNYTEIWEALFFMCDLFERTALEIGDKYGYPYPQKDADNVRDYLRYIRALPAGAPEQYPDRKA